VLVGGSGSALAAGGIKAAYVEQVIPAKTFSSTIRLSNVATYKTVGPSAGIYGITSITLTNFDSSLQTLQIFVPVFASGGCGISGSSIPKYDQQMTVYLQPHSTLHLSFPTPLVVNPQAGVSCVGATTQGDLHGEDIEVVFNGVVN
jgi:hypothetical protein